MDFTDKFSCQTNERHVSSITNLNRNICCAKLDILHVYHVHTRTYTTHIHFNTKHRMKTHSAKGYEHEDNDETMRR